MGTPSGSDSTEKSAIMRWAFSGEPVQVDVPQRRKISRQPDGDCFGVDSNQGYDSSDINQEMSADQGKNSQQRERRKGIPVMSDIPRRRPIHFIEVAIGPGSCGSNHRTETNAGGNASQQAAQWKHSTHGGVQGARWKLYTPGLFPMDLSRLNVSHHKGQLDAFSSSSQDDAGSMVIQHRGDAKDKGRRVVRKGAPLVDDIPRRRPLPFTKTDYINEMPSMVFVSDDDGELDESRREKAELRLPMEDVHDGLAWSIGMSSPLGLKRRSVTRPFTTDRSHCTPDGRLLQGADPACASEISVVEAPASQDIDAEIIIERKRFGGALAPSGYESHRFIHQGSSSVRQSKAKDAIAGPDVMIDDYGRNGYECEDSTREERLLIEYRDIKAGYKKGRSGSAEPSTMNRPSRITSYRSVLGGTPVSLRNAPAQELMGLPTIDENKEDMLTKSEHSVQ